MFALSTAVVIYCLIVAAIFLSLWFYYDRRDHARFEGERRKATFHCITCGHLYTGPTGAEVSKCPKCNHENIRLRF